MEKKVADAVPVDALQFLGGEAYEHNGNTYVVAGYFCGPVVFRQS